MIIFLLLDKLPRIYLIKTAKLLPELPKKNLKDVFSRIGAILGSIDTVFIKFICTILSKSRRTILHCQLLNSLIENCLI